MLWLQTIAVLCLLSSPSDQSLLKAQTEGSNAHTICQQTMGYFKGVSRAEILSNLESLCEYTNSKDQCLENCEVFLQTIGDAVSELDESATCHILLSFGQGSRPYNVHHESFKHIEKAIILYAYSPLILGDQALFTSARRNVIKWSRAPDQHDEILIPETLLHENYKYLERVYKEYLRYVCQDYNEEDCTGQLQNAITQVMGHLQDGLLG
ncbi:hypothetical protein CRM22_008853 [Opisthorchis felineus]|uniref:Saposin B-type domain-containing protein n=2 Tax=Opisthorchis felineus TaxID=147828 RepID=A0A4S2LBD4_OPIFE|nr:hypothetical protein CRM22_008853 [Opisthorchis felineus]TGZ59867.1 hypothetical protein CRM22_008853 [Opisthorchis felineus]TGZ59868.1 hypothetical protein CRM22_008853 [Opisthorchis felineus]TGZ59869.1 hypothetical protein CRM22_008853 [Opisthorchis felineus]